MTIPDKDLHENARLALAEFDKWVDDDRYTLRFESIEDLAAVAQAFVEGNLIPGEVDYEAAARELALLCRTERSIVDVVNNDPGPAARRAARAIVDAALAFRESGEK